MVLRTCMQYRTAVSSWANSVLPISIESRYPMIYRPIGSRIHSKSEIASRYRSEYRSSLQASEKVPNFRQKKGLCLRYRKGYQKCYSASRCPCVGGFSDQYFF